ncbi:MAG TPA: NYN domain-containing protein [Nitrospirae bacterium]|nr:NYN domain-containing protein [Nitrospirota bacterium]
MKDTAVVIDYENLFYSAQNLYSRYPDLDLLMKLCEKRGRIASCQAYADWTKFQDRIQELFKAGIQPVFSPVSRTGKSSADTIICVHTMKLFYSNPNLETLLLVSGDRDFIPLVVELKSMGKNVFVVGINGSYSEDLKEVADELILYSPEKTPSKNTITKSRRRQIDHTVKDLLIGAVKNQSADDDGWVNLAGIGLGIKKITPDFDHRTYGFTKLINMFQKIDSFDVKKDDDTLAAYVRLKAKNS